MGAAPKLVIIERKSTGPLDTPWGAVLRQIEGRIKDNESTGMEARWESGRELLKRRKGKKLPKGLLDQAAEVLEVDRLELQRRVRFAERFQTKDALCHAVTQYPTWHSMVKDGLPVKRKPKKLPAQEEAAKAVRLWIKRTQKLQEEFDASALTDDDVAALHEVGQWIHDILEELG